MLRLSVGLFRWVQEENTVFPAIVLLTMIDSFYRTYFLYSLKTSDQTLTDYKLEILDEKEELMEKFSGSSDIHTYSNLWNKLMNDVGGLSAPSTDVRVWCENNKIRYENIHDVINTVKNIRNVLRENNIKSPTGHFDTENTLELLSPILKEIYSDRTYYLDPNQQVRVRYMDSDGNYYKIDNHQGINTIDTVRPEVVYGLIVGIISSSYGPDFNVLTCSLV